MDELEIPQMIDNFPQLMFWEVDEVMPVLFGMAAGLLFDRMGTGMILGGCLSWIYIGYKHEALPGSLFHICFWWGIYSLNEAFKNGLNRESIQ